MGGRHQGKWKRAGFWHRLEVNLVPFLLLAAWFLLVGLFFFVTLPGSWFHQ